MKITVIEVDGITYIPTHTDVSDDDLCIDCDLKNWCTPNFFEVCCRYLDNYKVFKTL